MPTLVWITFSLLALLWTGGAWLGAELLQWTAGALASGGGWDVEAISLRIPAWLEPWVDMGWLLGVLDLGAQLLAWARGVWPPLGSLLAALVPWVWGLWALGLALLLALAIGLHRLVRPRPELAAPA